MSKPRSVIVDGTDLSSIQDVTHFEVVNRFNGVDAQMQTELIAGIGAVEVSDEPQMRPRLIRLQLYAEATTRAALVAVIDELRWRLGPRKLRVFQFVDDETRESTGRVIGLRFPLIRPQLSQAAVEVEVDILCPDPREYESSNTVVSAIGATDKDLPLGSAPSRASIVVTGAAAFILTYKNAAGTTIHTLEISGAASPVTVDMVTGEITDNNGNAADHLVQPSDFPFSFDPDDGDFSIDDWPTLACSAGTAVATYQKAY